MDSMETMQPMKTREQRNERRHTVIQWRKGSSIDVEVGINLDRGDLETHGLEEETSGRGDNTLADTGDDTSRDENVLLDHCGEREVFCFDCKE